MINMFINTALPQTGDIFLPIIVVIVVVVIAVIAIVAGIMARRHK